MVAVFLLILSGCNTVELTSGLSESSATDVIVVLRQNGIAAEKFADESGQDKTWTVTVAAGSASDAWQVLVENELPREEPKGFATFFGQSKLIPTETEEKALFLQAVCGELAATIEAMPSVIDARVHVSIPEKDPLRRVMEGQEPPVATAAVMVKHWKPSGSVPPEERVDEMDIKRLVASSVEGLKPENVTVVTKAVTRKMTEAPSGAAGAANYFLPLAGLAGVLLVLLLITIMRMRSLSSQLAAATAGGASGKDEPAE
jgi:type III secretion protein J